MKSCLVTCSIFVVVFWFGFATCDINQDRAKCANQLVGLATCLPYVSGQANAPAIDCCKGFKEVIAKSAECVCLLVKDKDDPSLGLKINATRALSLQTRCDLHTDQSITDCANILHLPPNSPEAKVFNDFANSGKNSSSPVTPTPAAAKSTASGSATGVASQSSEGWQVEQTWLVGLIITMLAQSL